MVYSKTDYRRNLIKYWRQFFPNWTIPKGYQVHHIVPQSIAKQDGWTGAQINHPKNLIALHIDDHISIHKCRGDKFICEPFMLSLKGLKRIGVPKGTVPWNKGKIGSQVAWNKGLKTGPNSKASNEKRSQTMVSKYKTEKHPRKDKDPWNKNKPGSQVAWNKGTVMRTIKCPHCDKVGSVSNMKRWHGDNCKENNVFN